MARASAVTFDLHAGRIPLADPGRAQECMTWGDDYQLLFTADERTSLPVGAHRIGTVIATRADPLRLDGQDPGIDRLGYIH